MNSVSESLEPEWNRSRQEGMAQAPMNNETCRTANSGGDCG